MSITNVLELSTVAGGFVLGGNAVTWQTDCTAVHVCAAVQSAVSFVLQRTLQIILIWRWF